MNRNDNGDLHGLMSREAKGAIVIDLAVGMSVRDLQDAGNQHERHTENSQQGDKGTPRPTSCTHPTHVIQTIAWNGDSPQRCGCSIAGEIS